MINWNTGYALPGCAWRLCCHLALKASLAPQAVVSGVLDFSPAELPDANTWPTHGALRERLLLACKTLEVPACHAVRDAFLAELVRLTPPELASLVRCGVPEIIYRDCNWWLSI